MQINYYHQSSGSTVIPWYRPCQIWNLRTGCIHVPVGRADPECKGKLEYNSASYSERIPMYKVRTRRSVVMENNI